MIDKFAEQLKAISQKERSTGFKIATLALGSVVFITALPALLILVSMKIDAHWPWLVRFFMMAFFGGVGAFFLLWSVITQWRLGHGTPAPIAPTQKLIVQGPYKLCRNPIQLGACCLYTAMGVYFGGLSTGLYCFAGGMILGSIYHKLVEEKELLLRFGEEYEQYKKTTPFVIPKI